MKDAVNDAIRYVLKSMRHIRKGDIPSAILVCLVELGFTPQSDGFGYLRKAIYRKCMDADQRFSEMYVCIGQMYTPPVSSFQVEQAIRSAITGAWEQRDRRSGASFSRRIGRETRKSPPMGSSFPAWPACWSCGAPAWRNEIRAALPGKLRAVSAYGIIFCRGRKPRSRGGWGPRRWNRW